MIRRKYLGELATLTGRPVIVYASGWLESRPVPTPEVVSVATRDLMGFMEAVHGLEQGPLDLMLHSPGGDPNAAQAIMSYLRDQGFGPIRAIVPVSAMSAATMMALSCDEILLGHHSQLGPIDPQLSITTPEGPRSAPAQAILDQFDDAKKQCAESPEALAAWLPILRGYGPGLLSQCKAAQAMAQELVAAALEKYMFADLSPAQRGPKAAATAQWFNDHATHRSHGRAVRIDDARKAGVKVVELEADNDLQNAVLTAWHGIQLTLSQIPVFKLIENSNGKTWLMSGGPVFELSPGSPMTGRTPGRLEGPSVAPPANRASRRQAERLAGKDKSSS